MEACKTGGEGNCFYVLDAWRATSGVFPDLGERKAVKSCIVGIDLGSCGSNVSVRMNLAVIGSEYLSEHPWNKTDDPDRQSGKTAPLEQMSVK